MPGFVTQLEPDNTAPRSCPAQGRQLLSVQYAQRTRWLTSNSAVRARSRWLAGMWVRAHAVGRGRPAPAQRKNKVHLEVCSVIKPHSG